MCAIKLLKNLSQKDMEMVAAEVEAMSKIDHPNVLKMTKNGKAEIVKNGKSKGVAFYIAL
jgi:flagellar motor switch protein FliG